MSHEDFSRQEHIKPSSDRRRTRASTPYYRLSNKRPAAPFWSTPASTFAESRSCVRPKMPSTALWVRSLTRLRSAISISKRASRTPHSSSASSKNAFDLD